MSSTWHLQERIRSLLDERKFLVDSGWTGGDDALTKPRQLKGEDSSNGRSTMVEKERQRLEVLKRKQERELQQVGGRQGGGGGEPMVPTGGR